MTRKLIVVGVSHRTAPIALRERLAVTEDQLPAELETMARGAGLEEAVLISTCNRVEVIGTSAEPAHCERALLQYWNDRLAPEQVDTHLYRHHGRDAARHLFRVAAGLDSMVLGEPQILGQVKEAFGVAQRVGTIGTQLGRSFERSFGVAKRVRTETALAAGNVSVSSIACDLAEKIFGDLAGRRVLLVGAGKMSEVAARSLGAKGAHLYVVNRSPERAQTLAKACGGTPRPLEALATELAEADVVISSTAKQGYVITHELMQAVCKIRRYKPLFVIDIAVPRDVDPRIDSLRNVFLYDMDDLQKVSRENLAARERAVADAELIIEAELGELDRFLRSVELTPTIVALRERVHGVLRAELKRTLPKLALDAAAQQKLEAMCDAMVNKLLHQPLTELKQGESGTDGVNLVEAVQRLFGLTPLTRLPAVTHPIRDDGERSVSGVVQAAKPGESLSEALSSERAIKR